MAELFSERHLLIARAHLADSNGIIVVRYATDHTIIGASGGFESQVPEGVTTTGESIHRFLSGPDGRNCSMLSTGVDELPAVFTIRMRLTERTYICSLYSDEDGYVLIGERLAETESDTLERMSLMTNELASLTLELRKRNADLEGANETIRELTRIDPLTELANRRWFAEALDTAMTFAVRHEQPLCLMSIDSDHFKYVNDTHGHDAGDEVLKALAQVLRDSSRNEDLPVRIGGEEFLLLTPNTVIDEAYAMAERLREKVEAAELAPGHKTLTVSIGVTHLVEGDNYFNFLKRADMALYEAKSGGRNKTVVRTTSDPKR